MIPFVLARATQEDVDEISEMEAASYPSDEAASREGISMRIREAGDFFYAAREEPGTPRGRILGFVNGTKAAGGRLTHETMSRHDAEGTLLCIHSVVVCGECRRRGIGSRMLREYVDAIRRAGLVREMRLLCKEHLIGFYEAAGFEYVSVSEVVHGADQVRPRRLPRRRDSPERPLPP